MLISPWVDTTTKADSFRRNSRWDMIDETSISRWSAALVDAKDHDAYSQAVTAPSGWWQGSEKVVKSIVVWIGGCEVLIDPIEQFDEALKSAHGDVTELVEPRALHVRCMNWVMGSPKYETQKALEGWLKERF